VEDSAQLYKNADVNVISILPGIIKTALPLKTASCLAAQKPIIFIGLETFYHNEEWVNEVSELYPINYRNYEKVAETIEKLANAKTKPKLKYDQIELFDKEKNVNEYFNLITKYLKEE
jgi:hypothetical protein